MSSSSSGRGLECSYKITRMATFIFREAHKIMDVYVDRRFKGHLLKNRTD